MAKRKPKFSTPPLPDPPPAPPGRLPRLHQPGRTRCLGPGCEAYFDSPDKCCVRLCPRCRAKQGRNYLPPTASTAAFHGEGYRLDD